MMRMKRTLTLLLVTVSLMVFQGAMAHGDAKPKHGGVVQAASDLNFELVAQADGVVLYLEDHDQPLPSAGFSGKLTVLQDGVKSEAPLKPVGDNKLAAAGLKFGAGAKAVAVVVTPQNQTIAVRFALR